MNCFPPGARQQDPQFRSATGALVSTSAGANPEPSGPSLAILTQQISHYHAARYRAAAQVFARVSVISSMNDADFQQFLCSDHSDIDANPLYQGRDAYLGAVAQGHVWSASYAALDKTRPDVVAVAGWAFPESLGAIAWARHHGARVVMLSASQQNDSPRFRIREAIKSRVVGTCDAALVGGERQSQYIIRLGIPRECIFFGYDAVDNAYFAEAAARARAKASALRCDYGLPKRYLLASARFIAKKNLKRLVEAFARALLATKAPHTLVILGDGPERQEVERAISAVGLGDRILLPGFKNYASLPVYYGLADAFVHVSLAEQWGLVINEAAASGLPLIVSRPCGAAAELVVEGANGYLVDPMDVEDMAGAFRKVLTATDARRGAMGAESQQIVSAWGPERFAQGLRDAAQAALNCPRRRLAPWDAILMRILSRRYFSAVS